MPFADPEFRSDIERMLVYLSWSRRKYLDLFERLPWRVLVRRHGSTFESIRDVHLHILAVYSNWLYGYFGKRSMKPIVGKLNLKVFAKVKNVRQLRDLNEKIDECAQRTARSLGPDAFDRKKRVGPPGRRSSVSPREVFWHMIEEDFLHTGEIICMLWQDDIEPPYTGVLWFEYDNNPEAHQDLWFRDSSLPRPTAGGYVKRRATSRPVSS
jgi:uncharacterized damage-inducible protein DinB